MQCFCVCVCVSVLYECVVCRLCGRLFVRTQSYRCRTESGVAQRCCVCVHFPILCLTLCSSVIRLSFVPLLTPLSWAGVFMPILPEKLVDFVDSPVPAIVSILTLSLVFIVVAQHNDIISNKQTNKRTTGWHNKAARALAITAEFGGKHARVVPFSQCGVFCVCCQLLLFVLVCSCLLMLFVVVMATFEV